MDCFVLDLLVGGAVISVCVYGFSFDTTQRSWSLKLCLIKFWELVIFDVRTSSLFFFVCHMPVLTVEYAHLPWYHLCFLLELSISMTYRSIFWNNVKTESSMEKKSLVKAFTFWQTVVFIGSICCLNLDFQLLQTSACQMSILNCQGCGLVDPLFHSIIPGNNF